ncbi:MAG: DNA polymerase III subunit delta' [Thermodesulfobacteriota bacterium]
MPTIAPAIPTRFAEVLGQAKAKEMLRRAMASAKMSHAYLFRGPAGVGKKTMAHAFAATINCAAPISHEACGSCPSCQKFRSGNHPDFQLIAPEGASIKIQQIRELKKSLAFPPFEAHYRVILIADAHTMRRETANSLLKTLEEPPANTVLVLTADEASGVLPTIVSRCQVIPFFALPQTEVAQHLMAEAAIAPEQAATLAGIAEGSLGRARLLLDKDLLPLRRQIVATLLDLEPDGPETVETIFDLAEKTAALKEELPELLDLLRTWYRDLLLAGNSQPLNQDLAFSWEAGRQRWPEPELLTRLGRIEQAKRELARNCNRALVCEVLFFALL